MNGSAQYPANPSSNLQQPAASPPQTTYPQQPAASTPQTTYPQQPATSPPQTTYPQQPATSTPQTTYPQQPAASPPQSTNAQQPAGSSQFAQQVLDLVNQERSKTGASPLSMSSELNKVAMAKAMDMYNNNYFDHQSPTYGSPFDMMQSYGISYNAAGENIAKGQTTPAEVMNQWMNSEGHRANILNSSYTQIGIAYYNSEWVQEFTG
ncbi:SCP-like extracellular [Paenibacillus thalictri]|uniref:SCP-like extracellular n=2 Tax=Paenibacillus thalictri TaxID=2527873 RepID=A0A4Q9DNR6_9BACL|nr:SCP-like extracellular [Paenibacillus thalictri]